MTFTDDQGKRMRLWMKGEVGEITDAQAFVDMYIARILSVLDNEKIDIYVNPTFLPEIIASQYDELWTEVRMNRVVEALVKNNIALEINARYKIPSVKFIKLAKSKGVKFAFGTNNTGQDFANLDYCLQMQRECDLKPKDMFFPKPEGQKPIQVK
jgi:histidinol phosphatase-like PHP family hydrolase